MRNAMFVVLLALPVGWFVFAQPNKMPPMPPLNGAVDSENLGKQLKEAGFEPRSLSDDVFQVSVEHDAWKVHIMVSAPREGERIWLECKFAPVGDPASVPASAWRHLLEENERISPAHFAFDKSDKRVHLYKGFRNHDVSPARLKKEIDAFDAVVRRTHSVWKAEKFTPVDVIPVPRVAPTPEDLAKLKGKWRTVRMETNGEAVNDARLRDLKRTYSIDGDTAVVQLANGKDRKFKLRIDSSSKPKQIDFLDEKECVERGIWMIGNGLLTICVAGGNEERPFQFLTTAKDKNMLFVLKLEE
jgi:uncharacterized protein (TIGR03067 family)